MASTLVEEAFDVDVEATARLVNRVASFVEAFGHPIRLRIVGWAYERPGEKFSAIKYVEDTRRQFAARVELAVAAADRGEPPIDVGPPPPSLGVVSYHVRKLRKLGLAQPAGERRVRGAVEHLYTLTPQAMVLLESAASVLAEPDGR